MKGIVGAVKQSQSSLMDYKVFVILKRAQSPKLRFNSINSLLHF